MVKKKEYALICDVGYGDVKYIVVDDNIEEYHQGKIPSLLASMDILDLSDAMGSDDVFEYRDQFYLVGSDAGISFGAHPISSMSRDFILNYAPLFLAKIAQVEGLKPQQISLVILSLAFLEYEDNWKKLSEICSDFIVSKKRFTQEVQVFMQGVGIWYDQESPDNCLIIDIGFNTIDVILALNGSVRKELSFGLKGYGTSNFIHSVKEYLNKRSELQFNINEVQQMIIANNPVLDKFKMRPVIKRFSQTWMERLLSELQTYEQFNRAEKMGCDIIVAGGGAYYLKGLSLPSNYRLVDNEPEFANVRGFLVELRRQTGNA